MYRKMIRFGDNVKIFRNKNKWTQEKLANEIGVVRQTVAAWENKLSCPDVTILVRIQEIFDISMDELIYGDMPNVYKSAVNHEIFYEEDIIRSIKRKGVYDILAEDIQHFFPSIDICFARVMGIVMGLNGSGYRIISVYSNGFSIYFSTDEEAEKFPRVLYDIIDAFMHFETEKTVVAYSEKVQERIDEIEIDVLRETHKAIYGADIEDMFYWIDEYDQIRGYGNSEEECREQARQQECVEYIILHE